MWGVTQPLASGEVVTLTVGDAYYVAGESSSSFPVGVDVYGYVDSINNNTRYGNIEEGIEDNNISDRVTSTAGGGGIVTTVSGSSVDAASLPRRE